MMRPTALRPLLTVAMTVALSAAVLAGCGGSGEPASSPTPSITVSPTPSASTGRPTTTEAPAPLEHASVVIVRELPDGRRRLVAYDFSTGQTKELVPLSRDEDPAVSPDGTQVVVERANGPWRDPITNHWLSKSGSRLVMIDLVDGDETQLTPIVEGTRAQTPQWNRIDGWLYYITSTPGPEKTRTNHLMRVQPDTGQIQRVPHGRGITGFTLMPDERYAWVRTTLLRQMTVKGACEAWRLNLTTGQVNLHRAHVCQADALVWSAHGDRLAYTSTGLAESSSLHVATWPGSWQRPWQQSAPPVSRLLYEGPGRPGSSGTFFGSIGWTPDDRSLVLASRHATWGANWTSPKFDRWYISLIERRTGERTDITPAGVADTSFDVWWPAP